MRMRSPVGLNMPSPCLVPKALVETIVVHGGAVGMNWPGECGSVVRRCMVASSRILMRQAAPNP